jgi:hypothetical protein
MFLTLAQQAPTRLVDVEGKDLVLLMRDAGHAAEQVELSVMGCKRVPSSRLGDRTSLRNLAPVVFSKIKLPHVA